MKCCHRYQAFRQRIVKMNHLPTDDKWFGSFTTQVVELRTKIFYLKEELSNLENTQALLIEQSEIIIEHLNSSHPLPSSEQEQNLSSIEDISSRISIIDDQMEIIRGDISELTERVTQIIKEERSVNEQPLTDSTTTNDLEQINNRIVEITKEYRDKIMSEIIDLEKKLHRLRASCDMESSKAFVNADLLGSLKHEMMRTNNRITELRNLLGDCPKEEENQR